jgi:SAM-dependent methyltransferase
VTEWALPPSDEPFDFRHQAARYARYRRDYSPALYDAIEARTGAGRGRRAVDLGCGTGFVAAALGRRGWRPIGIDFSVPMLAEARRTASEAFMLVRARGEALPLVPGHAALVACGTAFHWLAPVPALAEIHRVLAPGGWVAVFWRDAAPGEPSVALVREALSRFGVALPDLPFAHSPDPFAGSALVPEAPLLVEGVLRFTVEEFLGWVSTVEWIRRLAGPHHAGFLASLEEALAHHAPDGLEERSQEHLFLARKPGP